MRAAGSFAGAFVRTTCSQVFSSETWAVVAVAALEGLPAGRALAWLGW